VVYEELPHAFPVDVYHKFIGLRVNRFVVLHCDGCFVNIYYLPLFILFPSCHVECADHYFLVHRILKGSAKGQCFTSANSHSTYHAATTTFPPRYHCLCRTSGRLGLPDLSSLACHLPIFSLKSAGFGLMYTSQPTRLWSF